jgi:hypothetical protein
MLHFVKSQHLEEVERLLVSVLRQLDDPIVFPRSLTEMLTW